MPGDVLELQLTGRAGEYAAGGLSPSQMDGYLVACTVVAATGAPLCSEWNGAELGITSAVPRHVQVVNASVSGGGFTVTVQAPAAALGVQAGAQQRLIAAAGGYSVAGNAPLQHGSGSSDRGHVIVDIYAGTATTAESQTLRWVAIGVTVAAMLAAVGVGAVLNFRRIVLGPTAARAASIVCAAGFCGLVALYVGMCYADNRRNLKSLALERALGDGAVFCLWFVLYPVPKHVGLGTLVGSSYERLVPYHLLVGALVAVVATAHLIAMALRFPAEELFAWRGENPPVAGFLAWLLTMVVVVSSLTLRRRAYFVFRLLHVLAVPALVLAVVHYPKLGLALVPPVANYAVDVALRVRSHVKADARITRATFHAAEAGDNGNGNGGRTDAADGGFAALTVQLAAGAAEPGPGSFVLLGVAAAGPRCDPHPVSVAWYDAARREARLFVKSAGASSWSGRLCAAAAQKRLTGAAALWVGPLGSLQVPLGTTRTVVLVAGGVGITPMLSLLQAVRERRAGGERVERACLLWAVRDAALLREVAPLLAECARGAAPSVGDLMVSCTDGDDGEAPATMLMSASITPSHDQPRHQKVAITSPVMLAASVDPGGVAVHIFCPSAAGAARLPRDVTLHCTLHTRRMALRSDVATSVRSATPTPLGRASKRSSYHSGDDDAQLGVLDREASLYCCGPASLMAEAADFASSDKAARWLLHTETFEL